MLLAVSCCIEPHSNETRLCQWLHVQWFLTHWGRVTHLCVSILTIIASDNGLSPGRCQAIIWTNAGILWIGPWGTNFNEILIGIPTFSFKKMHLKMSSAKWRPFCLGLNVLSWWITLLYNGVKWTLRLLKSPTTRIFVQVLVEAKTKGTNNVPWSLCERNPLDSRHKGPVIWTAFPCIDPPSTRNRTVLCGRVSL